MKLTFTALFMYIVSVEVTFGPDYRQTASFVPNKALDNLPGLLPLTITFNVM